MSEVLRMAQVSKSFRGTPVLSDVELQLNEGDCLAVTGPNGAGKSVLFRLMARLMRPDRGEVVISERYLSKRRTFPEQFGIIIDRPGFQAGLTGYENLAELARIRKRIGKDQIIQTMQRVGLDPAWKQNVGKYSLGMKQKLALAQAIMEDQQVLILDEPFNALDATSVLATRDLIQERLRAGVTVVFCSHNRDDVDELATRVVTIENGQLIEQAT